MELFLITGYIGQAATTLTDAKALLAALLNPTLPSSSGVVSRIAATLPALVQSDSGEPLVISSIDGVAGTISAWVTDVGTTLAVGLGDQDPATAGTYASTSTFAIDGTTRTGVLALNTRALADALTTKISQRRYATSGNFVLHIRKTVGGSTESVGLIPIEVQAGVLSSPLNEEQESQANSAAESAAAAAASETAAATSAAAALQSEQDAAASAAAALVSEGNAAGSQAAAAGSAADSEASAQEAAALLAPGIATLTDGATVNWDLTASPVAQLTLGGSRTLAVTNLQAGANYELWVQQGGSGSYTLTWPAEVIWPFGVAPVLSTTVGRADLILFCARGGKLYGSYLVGYTA